VERNHDEELCDLYSSPNVIPEIKSRSVRWAGHVACLGGRDLCTGFGGEV
jgi:hypothetical protein